MAGVQIDGHELLVGAERFVLPEWLSATRQTGPELVAGVRLMFVAPDTGQTLGILVVDRADATSLCREVRDSMTWLTVSYQKRAARAAAGV